MRDAEKIDALVNMMTLSNGRVVSVFMKHNEWIELRVFDPITGNSELRWGIGDPAIFGSFNLIYTGPITKITRNTVTIEGYSKPNRFKIEKFVKMNQDFNMNHIREHNRQVGMSI